MCNKNLLSVHAPELQDGCVSQDLRFTPDLRPAQKPPQPASTPTDDPTGLRRPLCTPARQTRSRPAIYIVKGGRVYQDRRRLLSTAATHRTRRGAL